MPAPTSSPWNWSRAVAGGQYWARGRRHFGKMSSVTPLKARRDQGSRRHEVIAISYHDGFEESPGRAVQHQLAAFPKVALESVQRNATGPLPLHLAHRMVIESLEKKSVSSKGSIRIAQRKPDLTGPLMH